MNLSKVYEDCYIDPSYKMGKARYNQAKHDLTNIITPQHESFVDIGCGRGEIMALAESLGITTIQGTEFVQSLLNINVEYAEITNLPFDDNSFDVVTCLDVIEHIEPDDTKPALQELKRIAKDSIYISINNDPSIVNGFDLHINKRGYIEWNHIMLEEFPDCNVTWLPADQGSINQSWLIQIG